MSEHAFVTLPDGSKRAVDWDELDRLKKDILLFFDHNTGQLDAAFVPPYSYRLRYWEYLNLEEEGNTIHAEELKFFIQGALIIVTGMLVEFLDEDSERTEPFGKTSVKEVLEAIDYFVPSNPDQEQLKDIVIQGLEIVLSMEEAYLENPDDEVDDALQEFYDHLEWIDKTFIKTYYRSKLR